MSQLSRADRIRSSLRPLFPSVVLMAALAAAVAVGNTRAYGAPATDPEDTPTGGGQDSDELSPRMPPPIPPRFLVDRLAAGSSFGYFSNDSLRFLARVHFDFPFFVARQKGVYVRGDLTSSISRIENDFTPQVEDVDYVFELGTRDYLSSRTAVAAFVSQQGSENLDEPGSAWVRMVGLGAQSATFPRPGGDNRFDWNVALAAVVDKEGFDAGHGVRRDPDWVVRADLLWEPIRLSRSRIGADLSFDSLIFASGDWSTDIRVGPRWSFDLDNGIRTSLFARYINGGNPLGIGVDGVHIGFSYSEGAYRGPRQGRFPDVRGTLAAGWGEDRSPGSFLLEADLPTGRLARFDLRPFIIVEASTLVGRGPDNFLAELTGGVELDLPRRVVTGLYLTHRSYHRLAEEGGVAQDLNLVEIGVRDEGWDFADRRPGVLVADAPGSWPGRLHWSFRATYIPDSTVKGDPLWIGRGGARWDLPAPRAGFTPFLLLQGDAGEASRARAGIGTTLPVDMTITLEYRRDNQIRSPDKNEIALVFSLYY